MQEPGLARRFAWGLAGRGGFYLAQGAVDALHVDLGVDSFPQAFHVADDAYFLPADLVQPFEGVHHGVEAVAVQGPEAFINEKDVDGEAFPAEGRKP